LSLKTPETAAGVDLGPLDRVSAWMHRPERPLDFGQILVLKATAPSSEALQKGAESARCHFGQSGCVLRQSRWEWAPGSFFEVQELRSPGHRQLAMEAFMVKPFALECSNPVQQLLLVYQGERILLTRMHHALADGLGALQWVAHQLAVARGVEPAVEKTQFSEAPALKTHPKARRKAPEAGRGPSSGLWSSSTQPSAGRRWSTLEIDAGLWRRRLQGPDGLRYNDVLAGLCLEAMCCWNLTHKAPVSGLALWHPINIRAQVFVGFGNGSSRVRIYHKPTDSLLDRCRSVHAQMEQAKASGEWHFPESPVFSWPVWLQKPVLKAVLNRPWVDMGSMLFSHMEKAGPTGEVIFEAAESLAWVGMLDRRFPAGIVAATQADTTWLTLTWDSGMWTDAEAAAFLALYQALLLELAQELDSNSSAPNGQS
jgi:hypothetical protein